MGIKRGWWGNTGTTLVEMMVVAGIMSILVSGIAAMMKNMAGGQRQMLQIMTTMDLEGVIRNTLMNPASCMASLYNLGAIPAGPLAVNPENSAPGAGTLLPDIYFCTSAATTNPPFSVPPALPGPGVRLTCQSILAGNAGVMEFSNHPDAVDLRGFKGIPAGGPLAAPGLFNWPPGGNPASQVKITDLRVIPINQAPVASLQRNAVVRIVMQKATIDGNLNASGAVSTGTVQTSIRHVPITITMDSANQRVRACGTSVNDAVAAACWALGGNYDTATQRCSMVNMSAGSIHPDIQLFPSMIAGNTLVAGNTANIGPMVVATGGFIGANGPSVPGDVLATGNIRVAQSTTTNGNVGATGNILANNRIVAGTPNIATIAASGGGSIFATSRIISGNPTAAAFASAPAGSVVAESRVVAENQVISGNPFNATIVSAGPGSVIGANSVVVGNPSPAAFITGGLASTIVAGNIVSQGRIYARPPGSPGNAGANWPAPGYPGNAPHTLPVGGIFGEEVRTNMLCLNGRCWTTLPPPCGADQYVSTIGRGGSVGCANIGPLKGLQ